MHAGAKPNISEPGSKLVSHPHSWSCTWTPHAKARLQWGSVLLQQSGLLQRKRRHSSRKQGGLPPNELCPPAINTLRVFSVARIGVSKSPLRRPWKTILERRSKNFVCMDSIMIKKLSCCFSLDFHGLSVFECLHLHEARLRV